LFDELLSVCYVCLAKKAKKMTKPLRSVIIVIRLSPQVNAAAFSFGCFCCFIIFGGRGL